MIYEFSKINKTAGLLQIPYVLWLVFASAINLRSLFFKLGKRVYSIFLLNKLFCFFLFYLIS